MPRTRIREDIVYKFSELNDDAKEKAREWYREAALDYDWWDFVFEDAVMVGRILGIEIDHREVPLMNGKTRREPVIYFSGFSSPGDGACFEGRYSYAKGWRKRLLGYAPQDKELLAIGEALQKAQHDTKWAITARTKQRGHYYHSKSMTIECWCDLEHQPESNDWMMTVEQCLINFADWIYARLESEHDWLLSDEAVDESIKANEYEFTQEGRIA
jgi:hypothetical protein